jgi:hypothetical protein
VPEHLTIARPAGEVFAFLADLRNIPRWNYAIARTVPTSPGPAGLFGAGSVVISPAG